MNKLFTPLSAGKLRLQHRVVMAPATRMRSESGGVPGDLMVEYYRQRASQGGLLIAEATAISPYANAYADAPGIFNDAQQAGWQRVVDSVHQQGGQIVLQLWHPGRQSLPELSQGHQPVAPSALLARETYGVGKRDDGGYAGKLFPLPRALLASEIDEILDAFRLSAQRAKDAGFDGVELHAANGYLPEQFLLDGSNQRQDRWGGSLANRARFLFDVLSVLTAVWGSGRVAVRISPSGIYGDMHDSDPAAKFSYVAEKLNDVGLAYLHIIEPRIVGPEDRDSTRYVDPVASRQLRAFYHGIIIAAGGFTPDAAEKMLLAGEADLIAFGRLFTSNPDLPARIRYGYPLTPYQRETFFGGDAAGYSDFPAYHQA
ncbi:alkene reductase [Erwinia sp. OLTSP20]|uniref:alkene reductase n=1 Tax=unclassified Erwinia TaxID=2622719 RepID=UPI000C190BBF|nr:MULTISPECIES: alkene reductase [unclassified Erwinia]PIJ49412.1 alkene reductase [Erwinia sp. OAMSP11]PIJ71088.1 alkene reductase [Erwinia sp. OLSSP12]PIJ79366.1 alkene reductase [Erwinia sp. OLCASP19]PIJ80904.1 alkene reductase [Erwinia sp. OLMTSP26]PIJ83706.1 alkene reductase [Erwinia sp. OLMDSP33]